MANWTRRQLTKAALAIVSTSLLVLDVRALEGGGAGSCAIYNYYDPYDGGGGGGCFYILPNGNCG